MNALTLYQATKHYTSPKLTLLINDIFYDWIKLKELADDNIKVTQKLKFVLGRVENIVGIGENAG